MVSQRITPKELSNLLVEKHQKFIEEYKKEFDILDRIFVLKEKQDQLEYWLHDSKDDPEKNQKYLKAMRAADKELLKLNEELKVLYSSNSNETQTHNVSKTNLKGRYNLLKNRIEMHKEAITYWDKKLKDLSKDKEAKKRGKVKKVGELKKKKAKKAKRTKKARK